MIPHSDEVLFHMQKTHQEAESCVTTASLLCAFLRLYSISEGKLNPAPAKTPVILDTDISDDIDDTWALALLLKSPELDLKLVVTDQGKTAYRARIVASLSRSLAARTWPSVLACQSWRAKGVKLRGLKITNSPDIPARCIGTAFKP